MSFMARAVGRVCTLGVALCACSLARAQDRPVEQGVGDVDPLQRSLRVISPDLRLDTAFEHIYRVDESDPQSPFYRRAGGLYAVFPQSEYYLTREGVVAGIPAGTVFHFGKPGSDAMPSVERPESLSIDRLRLNDISASRQRGRMLPTPIVSERLDRSAPPTDERTQPPPTTATPTTPPVPTAPARTTVLTDEDRDTRNPGVMSDNWYRARRLAQIAAQHAPASGVR